MEKSNCEVVAILILALQSGQESLMSIKAPYRVSKNLFQRQIRPTRDNENLIRRYASELLGSGSAVRILNSVKSAPLLSLLIQERHLPTELAKCSDFPCHSR